MVHWLLFFPLSHSILLVLSCLPASVPKPTSSPIHNLHIMWSPSAVFPTVFNTGLPGGSQALPSACCVFSLTFFAHFCLFVAIPVSPDLSLVVSLSAGLPTHTYSHKYEHWESYGFLGYIFIYSEIQIDTFCTKKMLSWVNTCLNSSSKHITKLTLQSGNTMSVYSVYLRMVAWLADNSI